MKFQHLYKAIAIFIVIIVAVLLIRNIVAHDAYARKLSVIENEQQIMKAELESVNDNLQRLTAQIKASQETQPIKDGSTNLIANNEPISSVTLSFNPTILSSPYIGNNASPLVMIAFLDYQCAPCRQFYRTTFAKLKSEYIDSKKIKFIFRDFPLSVNNYAFQAAQFAQCAGNQGFYWEAFNLLFEEAVLI